MGRAGMQAMERAPMSQERFSSSPDRPWPSLVEAHSMFTFDELWQLATEKLAEIQSESALRTEEPEAPRRACTLMLRIGADDRASLVRAVEEFARTIDERREPGGACGGYDYGWSYELSAKDRPTHDEYVAALDAYLEASDVRR